MKISNMINKAIDKKIGRKKQEEIKYYFKICMTLLIISAVTATVLAFVNVMTKEKIEENELSVMQDALGKIFDGCDEIEPVDGEYLDPVTAVYRVYKDGKKLGYGIQVAPTGFKDKIGMIVGTDNDGICLGVEITSISDTPGVGTKVKEGGFLSGFIGRNGTTVADCDTISGATISSAAVKEGISAALALDIFGADDEEESSDEPYDGIIETPEDNTDDVTEDTSENGGTDSESGENVEAATPEGEGASDENEGVAQESDTEAESV